MLILDEQELKNKVGKIISNKRKLLKLSQEKLADQLGIKLRTISKIENGHSFPSAKTFCKLSQVFGIPIKSFFEFDTRKTKNEQQLDDAFDKIKEGGKRKIEYFCDVIAVIDKDYRK